MVEVEENLQVMAFLIDFLATEIAEAQEQLVNGCNSAKKVGAHSQPPQIHTTCESHGDHSISVLNSFSKVFSARRFLLINSL